MDKGAKTFPVCVQAYGSSYKSWSLNLFSLGLRKDVFGLLRFSDGSVGPIMRIAVLALEYVYTSKWPYFHKLTT